MTSWKVALLEKPDPNIELVYRWKDHLNTKMKAWYKLKQRASLEEEINFSYDERVKFENRVTVWCQKQQKA